MTGRGVRYRVTMRDAYWPRQRDFIDIVLAPEIVVRDEYRAIRTLVEREARRRWTEITHTYTWHCEHCEDDRGPWKVESVERLEGGVWVERRWPVPNDRIAVFSQSPQWAPVGPRVWP